VILVPNPDQPVLLGGRGEEQPVRRVGQEVNGVGRPDLPDAGPAGARGIGVVVAGPDGEPHFGFWKFVTQSDIESRGQQSYDFSQCFDYNFWQQHWAVSLKSKGTMTFSCRNCFFWSKLRNFLPI
jgi:hypothetical protein